MHTPWIGKRRMLVIPAIVQGDPAYDPPSDRWSNCLTRRRELGNLPEPAVC
jgi:hypothetical protein